MKIGVFLLASEQSADPAMIARRENSASPPFGCRSTPFCQCTVRRVVRARPTVAFKRQSALLRTHLLLWRGPPQ